MIYYQLMSKYRFFLLIVLHALLVGCQQRQNYVHTVSGNRYAKGFEIRSENHYTVVTVFSPWQKGEVLATYYLVREDSVTTPSDGIQLHIPLQRLTATSCTHVGFLSALNRQDALIGICNPPIVYDPIVQERVANRQTADVGDAMTPNVERILQTGAEAVMVSTYAQGDAVTERLVSLGVPVIYNNEWTENDPLARAEWIRFVGTFFDMLPQADTIFNNVEKQYLTLKNTAAHNTDKRSIMSGNNFRGTWYMPSGNTYMGRLFKDAQAEYVYANDSNDFSIPMTIENVVIQFSTADVWVGAPTNTLNELSTIDERHTWFKAYQTGEVYNFLKRTTPDGANDFWESGVVHPERILNDLINILYPHLASDTLFYTKKLD